MQAGESQSSLWVSLGRMRAGQPVRGLLEARTREDEQSPLTWVHSSRGRS